MNMQEINASASPEVQMNENFEALDWASVYAKNALTTTGLTWGYLGGRWGGISITAGTLSLTAGGGSPTVFNCIVVNRATGAISVSTSDANWNNTGIYARVYKIETDADSAVVIEDHRAGPYGVHGAGRPFSWNEQTDSYTLALTDAENGVAMNKATANNLTIPLNSTVAFPVGTSILVYQEGAGQTSIVATGGVTLRCSVSGSPTLTALSGQYALATLVKRATDTWILSGDLAS